MKYDYLRTRFCHRIIQFLPIFCSVNMKFFAFLLLCCLGIVLVVALPSNPDLPSTVEQANEATTHKAEPDSIFDSPSALIREPRQLLRRLFHKESSDVVQPQTIYKSPIYRSGRNYVRGGSGAGYGYAKPVGYW